MYTKCPSCRAELSFLPPPNPESLPEGYKHRIRCPHCGVTIGVKINKVDVQATYPNGIPTAASQTTPTYPTQPQPFPQPMPYIQPMPYTQPQQMFAPRTDVKPMEQEEVAVTPTKRTGRPRNVMIMILSLIFVVLTVLAYKLDVTKLPDWASSLPIFSGLDGWELLIKDFDLFKALFSGDRANDIMLSIVYLFPMFLFTLSGISFLLALFGLIFKKYNRVINLIIGILIGVIAVTMLFYPQIIAQLDLKEYFKSILSVEGVMCFVCAGLGIIYFVFTILFMKSMKVKENEF